MSVNCSTPLHSSDFFFFNDPATTEIYPLPLHAALPISAHRCTPHRLACRVVAREPHRALDRRRQRRRGRRLEPDAGAVALAELAVARVAHGVTRSEEHTYELQSHLNLVCRLLLEKKKSS